MKAYVIKREDFFKIPPQDIPEGSICHAGPIWVILGLTQDERERIQVPIEIV